MVNLEELEKFIAEARKNTYARGGKPVENPSLAGSYQLEHRKDEYFYRDIYFAGEKNFIGQEVVYLKDEPIWSMVYCGSAEPPEVTDFLKDSLFTLCDSCRFGEGEWEFEDKKKDFRYEYKGEGTLERFHGKEIISIKGEKVYKLRCQGGLILK
jgi:hypothetical protein